MYASRKRPDVTTLGVCWACAGEQRALLSISSMLQSMAGVGPLARFSDISIYLPRTRSPVVRWRCWEELWPGCDLHVLDPSRPALVTSPATAIPVYLTQNLLYESCALILESLSASAHFSS